MVISSVGTAASLAEDGYTTRTLGSSDARCMCVHRPSGEFLKSPSPFHCNSRSSEDGRLGNSMKDGGKEHLHQCLACHRIKFYRALSCNERSELDFGLEAWIAAHF